MTQMFDESHNIDIPMFIDSHDRSQIRAELFVLSWKKFPSVVFVSSMQIFKSKLPWLVNFDATRWKSTNHAFHEARTLGFLLMGMFTRAFSLLRLISKLILGEFLRTIDDVFIVAWTTSRWNISHPIAVNLKNDSEGAIREIFITTFDSID